jgi:hypothetical protein
MALVSVEISGISNVLTVPPVGAGQTFAGHLAVQMDSSQRDDPGLVQLGANFPVVFVVDEQQGF